jgi:glycosyltransferase involved in cell wall biosynthesis
VLPGKSGILVSHGNIAALADAMNSLAESRVKVQEMGTSARQFAERFSWDNTARETEAHIRLAIADAGRT